jgi:hypothetical protein
MHRNICLSIFIVRLGNRNIQVFFENEWQDNCSFNEWKITVL